MTAHDDDTIKEAVRERYGEHARTSTSCCSSGCGCGTPSTTASLGYDSAALAAVPSEADLGLGCGNPLAMESIVPGETVLDLGSGGGIDCFLASRLVGEGGRVIGVDMTPDMIALARRNAERGGYSNVEFRFGELEDLPVDSATVDLIISNCVINLVPNKGAAFAEAFRVLAPGGRVSVSDIVITEPLPDAILASVGAYVACLGGAALLDDYLGAMRAVGFENVHVASERAYVLDADEALEFGRSFGIDAATREDLVTAARAFRSVTVQAVKPLS